jgi:hypothetical protein
VQGKSWVGVGLTRHEVEFLAALLVICQPSNLDIQKMYHGRLFIKKKGALTLRDSRQPSLIDKGGCVQCFVQVLRHSIKHLRSTDRASRVFFDKLQGTRNLIVAPPPGTIP